MKNLKENTTTQPRTNEERLQYYLNLSYPIEILEDDGAVVASVPDLPGCNAFGEDVDTAIASLKETKELWLRGRIEASQPIPEPSIAEGFSGKFVLRIPKSLHRALDREARHQGTSLNQYVSTLLSARHEAHVIKRLVQDLSVWQQSKKSVQKVSYREPRTSGGLDHRVRAQSGEIRSVRRDTRVATLREAYGEGFAPGYRGDTRLATLLEREGASSLTEYLKKRG